VAVARVRRAGKTASVVDVEVVDEEERLVALGRGTYSSNTG
jgi:acyl-coenzyme A thioesterase PaaI-like protein